MRFLLTIGLTSLLVSPVSAEGPRWAHHLNQLNRYFGEGWSDGYHVCRHQPRRFGSGLPPTPSWLRQRWTYPHALQGITAPPHAAARTGSEGDRIHWQLPHVQQLTVPAHSPVLPSILEEARRDVRAVDRTARPERAKDPERLEDKAEYEDFLNAAHRTSRRSARLPDSRFIHEPTADGPTTADLSTPDASASRCQDSSSE